MRKSFTLNNGIPLPAIGLGTFQAEDGNEMVKDATLLALKLGYRHIDTALAYGNEKEVGQAIKESGIPREEIYVTTKLAQAWHDPECVEEALNKSLESLGLEYVDLYLMHFPHAYKASPTHGTIRHPSGNGKPVIDYKQSREYPALWTAMECLVASGKAKSIGLSNFNILKTKRVLEVAKIIPAVNQVECHPYLPQYELIDFSQKHGIHIMAHQPLGGRALDVVNPNKDIPGPMFDPEIKRIATKNGISVVQVILSWLVQRGISTVPKSVHEEYLEENFDLHELEKEDFDIISDLRKESGPVRFLDPSNHLGFDIFDENEDQPVGNSAPWDTWGVTVR